MIRYCVSALAIAVLLLTLGNVGCAGNKPPNLSPEANAAWYGTQAVHGLDLLRDIATAANTQAPPLLSTATTRRVVDYHTAAVKIIDASPGNWKGAVGTGLDELTKNLPPGEAATLAPYVALVKTIIAEVH